MLEKVLETCYEMVKISKSVIINEKKIKKVSEKFKDLDFIHWLIGDKNRILNLPIDKQINFLLIFDSINYFFLG